MYGAWHHLSASLCYISHMGHQYVWVIGGLLFNVPYLNIITIFNINSNNVFNIKKESIYMCTRY